MNKIYAIYFYDEYEPYGYYDNIDLLKEAMFAIIKWNQKDQNTNEYDYIKTFQDVDLDDEYFGFGVQEITIANKITKKNKDNYGFVGMDRKYFL